VVVRSEVVGFVMVSHSLSLNVTRFRRGARCGKPHRVPGSAIRVLLQFGAVLREQPFLLPWSATGLGSCLGISGKEIWFSSRAQQQRATIASIRFRGAARSVQDYREYWGSTEKAAAADRTPYQRGLRHGSVDFVTARHFCACETSCGNCRSAIVLLTRGEPGYKLTTGGFNPRRLRARAMRRVVDGIV
jgi:hypothetical protein